MQLKANKFYFIVKIPIVDQRDRKEKIGSIYIAPSYVFMTRNMQSGIIVSIGSRVKEAFPEAKEGDLLIFHHFIEDDESLIASDAEFNYYAVPGVDIKITQDGAEKTKTPNRVYGIWDGERIIPHKEYVFLKKEEPANERLPLNEFINESIESSKGGLLVFKEWRTTTAEKVEKMERLKKDVGTLSHGGAHNAHIAGLIREKEAEMQSISATLNQKRYLPYLVAYANPLVSQWCDTTIGDNDILYMFNLGCQTEVEFNKTNFIVAKSEYIAFCFKN
jgi:hypothetical protein